jgi:HEPN domain-containing protein
MVDVRKQVEYWSSSSEEDLAAAKSLMEKGHFRHSLFFAHLAVEKMLKAHVTKQTGDIPPRIHNLVRLAELAEMAISAKQAAFLRGFGVYQMEGRYPDSAQVPLDLETARGKLALAQEMLEWLKSRL